MLPTCTNIRSKDRCKKEMFFAIRRTDTDEDIEIYWMRRGVEAVVWPYELHRYTADWPLQEPEISALCAGDLRGRPGAVGPDP